MFPGSFDPITIGHCDIAFRLLNVFSKVHVVVMSNSDKRRLFTDDERVEFARKAFEGFDNIIVTGYNGMTVDYAINNNINVIVRGLRSEADLFSEQTLSFVYRNIDDRIETFFISSSPQYMLTSSTVVREHLKYGASIEKYVHNKSCKAILEAYNKRGRIAWNL